MKFYQNNQEIKLINTNMDMVKNNPFHLRKDKNYKILIF
jgi:hypothetical protein